MVVECFLNKMQDHDLAWTIPLRLYGDGADAHRNQSWEMFTMLPLLGGTSSTLDTRLLLSVRNTTYTMSDCRDSILQVIAWSFECLRTLQAC